MAHASFSVLANRNFALLWAGQCISVAGTSLSTLAAGVVVYRLTGSALNVGLLMIATVLPSLLVGAVAGVCVDRGDRRHIMLAADLLHAALMLSIPFLIGWSVAWMYVAIVLINATSQFFNPANASLLQETVSDEELPSANTWTAISTLGAPSLGFALAGLIAAGLPIAWAFYLDGLSYLASAACNLQLRGLVTRAAPAGEHTRPVDVLSDLRTGAGFVLHAPVLRSLFLIYLPVFIAIGLFNTVLLPFHGRRCTRPTRYSVCSPRPIRSVSSAAPCC